MQRYFIEVAYTGTAYSGFQTQQNAITIQAEVEKAIQILCRERIVLTGSSRTDAGVHARQNFFHADTVIQFTQGHAYHLNAILPKDIVVKNIFAVNQSAHCRFDAVARRYEYHIVRKKDPFLQGRAFFYPYKFQNSLLDEMAAALLPVTDFTSFSKKHTQVKNFDCKLYDSFWTIQNDLLIYTVQGNRFLRGMVRALTATMLRLAKKGTGADSLLQIAAAKNCGLADFSVPAHGLYLKQVIFEPGVYQDQAVL